MTDWKEIDTAPKDGTWIELFRPPSSSARRHTRVIARWYEGDAYPAEFCWPDGFYHVDSEAGRNLADEMIASGRCHSDGTSWTHWREIGPAPT